jgi:hypothetical protein
LQPTIFELFDALGNRISPVSKLLVWRTVDGSQIRHFLFADPAGEEANKVRFKVKECGGVAITIAVALILYYRGARKKSANHPADQSLS